MNQHEILQEAKLIMDEFVQALNEAQLQDEYCGVQRLICTREPHTQQAAPLFITQFLKNAPATNNNCIVAEKKRW
ncbi:MAG: hypothetical protein ACMXYC_00970 [Candidatus Woesearchaeota archaeon]